MTETAEQVKGGADILIADADKPLRNALIDKVLNYQLCVRHSVREVGYHLWKAGLPKQDIKKIATDLKKYSTHAETPARAEWPLLDS